MRKMSLRNILINDTDKGISKMRLKNEAAIKEPIETRLRKETDGRWDFAINNNIQGLRMGANSPAPILRRGKYLPVSLCSILSNTRCSLIMFRYQSDTQSSQCQVLHEKGKVVRKCWYSVVNPISQSQSSDIHQVHFSPGLVFYIPLPVLVCPPVVTHCLYHGST